MNCFRANRLISAYIDGELAGVEQLQIREHLHVCRRCREEHDGLLALKRRLGALAPCEPRPGYDAMVLRVVHERCHTTPPVGGRRLRWLNVRMDWPWSLQLGAVAVAGCVSALFLVRPPDSRRAAASAASGHGMPVVATASRPAVAVRDVVFIHDDTVATPASSGAFTLDPVSMTFGNTTSGR